MPAPLNGIRVLDLSQIVSGPMAATMLADQGADVIKVEGPAGDPVRSFGPAKGPMSATCITVNRGKRGLGLDLKHPGAAPVLEAMIARADVLIENFRPGTMERLGFGYDRCAAINPQLIFASINGFGPDGPYANIRVYDPVIQAVSGIAATQSDAAGAPSLIKSLVCDKVTALTAAQAITAALFARERGAGGQRLDIAMLDAAIAFNWPEAMFNHSFADDPPPAWPEYATMGRLWPARDGMVAASALQDSEFVALCRAVGLDHFAEDPRMATLQGRMQHGELWIEAFSAAVAACDVDTLMAGFIAEGAVGGRVNSAVDLAADAQVIHNGSIAAINHGALGRVRTPRHAARFGATATLPPRPAPLPGEHGRAVLAEIGLGAEEIDALVSAGVILVPSVDP